MQDITDDEFDYALRLSFISGEPMRTKDWSEIVEQTKDLVLMNQAEQAGNYFAWRLYAVVAYMIIKHRQKKTMQQITSTEIHTFNKVNNLEITLNHLKMAETTQNGGAGLFGVFNYDYEMHDGYERIWRGYLDDKAVMKDNCFRIAKEICDGNIDINRKRFE